jgi:hypothetical protein
LDLIFGRPPDRHDREPERYVLEMRKRMDAAQSWARTNIGKYIRRKEWRYNAEKKVFQAGVKVWLFTPVVDSSTKRKLSNYWSGPWTVVEKLTDLLYRIASHNEWRTWMKIQVVGINRLKLYREKKDSNEPDLPIVEPPRQESLEYPDDEFLLDWEDGAEGVEDPDMPYYLGGGGGGGQPPPPPPPPPGPQGGGGGVPAHAPVVGGAGQGGVATGAPPPPVQGEPDDVVQQPVGGGMAEDFPPPPQLPDLERVEDPEAPQGEDQEGWQVDADLDEAAGNEGINDDTFVIRGNGNRVLDAGQLDPNNGEQVEGDQEVLAGQQRRTREADEGADDDGNQGGLAGGEQDAQGRIVTGPGSILSLGNSPPRRVTPDPNGPRARQLKLQLKRDEVARLRVLRDQVQQGELEVQRHRGTSI